MRIMRRAVNPGYSEWQVMRGRCSLVEVSALPAGFIKSLFSFFPKFYLLIILRLILTVYFHPDSSVINVDPKLSFSLMAFLTWISKPHYLNFMAQLLKSRFFGEEDVRNTTDIADIAIAKVRAKS